MTTDESAWIEAGPTGMRVRFFPVDSDDDRVRFEIELAEPSQSHGPIVHVHPKQTEILETQSGTLGVRVGSETVTLDPGERIAIEPGEAHRFWNAGESKTRAVGEVTPGLQSEQFMRTLFGLLNDHMATRSGILLNPLRLAPVLDEYPDILYLAAVPVGLQQAVISGVASVSRLFGYEGIHSEYLPE
jgi:mannose-6-phosphate isomerase-like protein (cupin superfamily)